MPYGGNLHGRPTVGHTRLRKSKGIVIIGLILLPLVLAMIFRGKLHTDLQAQSQYIVIRPPMNAGSGSGTFMSLDNAIDPYEFTASVGQVGVGCYSTCTAELEKVSVWQNFPGGFIPHTLEVKWASGW